MMWALCWEDRRADVAESRRQGALGARSARAHSRIRERDLSTAGQRSISGTSVLGSKHRPLIHGLVLVIISAAVGYASILGNPFHSGSRAFAAPITGLTMPGVSSSIPPSNQTVLRPPAINRTLRAEQPIGQTQREAEAARSPLRRPRPTAEPTVSQEDAVVRAAAVAPKPEQPLYQVYTVQDGDTVSVRSHRSSGCRSADRHQQQR